MRSTILEFIEVYCIAQKHTRDAMEAGLNYAAATLTAPTISTEFIISHKWTGGVKRRLKLSRCNLSNNEILREILMESPLRGKSLS